MKDVYAVAVGPLCVECRVGIPFLGLDDASGMLIAAYSQGDKCQSPSQGLFRGQIGLGEMTEVVSDGCDHFQAHKSPLGLAGTALWAPESPACLVVALRAEQVTWRVFPVLDLYATQSGWGSLL